MRTGTLLLLALGGCTYITGQEHNQRLAAISGDTVAPLVLSLDGLTPNPAPACTTPTFVLDAAVDEAYANTTLASSWRIDGKGAWSDGPPIELGAAVQGRVGFTVRITPSSWPPPLGACEEDAVCSHQVELALVSDATDDAVSTDIIVAPNLPPTITEIGLHQGSSGYTTDLAAAEAAGLPVGSLSADAYPAIEVRVADLWVAAGEDATDYELTLWSCPTDADPTIDTSSCVSVATSAEALRGSTGDWGFTVASADLVVDCIHGPRHLWLDLGQRPCDQVWVDVDELWFTNGDCDDDGDPGITDCDDLDSARAHGHTEVMTDGIDQDCDGAELCYVDTDGDQHGSEQTALSAGDLSCTAAGVANIADDCDDTDATIHKGAPEVVGDDIDQDCDTWLACFDDGDLDSFGSTTTLAAMSAGGTCVADGFGAAGGDCDDGDPSVHPDATEVVNDDLDQNCDGWELCPADADGDGYGDPNGATELAPYVAGASCLGAGVADNRSDCDDQQALANPGVTERCGPENDCDPGTWPTGAALSGTPYDSPSLAVAAAQDGDIVEVCHPANGGAWPALVLPSGFSLSLRGWPDQSDARPIFDAGGVGSVIHADDVALTLQQIELRGGAGTLHTLNGVDTLAGGGLYNPGAAAALSLVDVLITQNSAGAGGGVYAAGEVSLSGVVITSNTASVGGGLYAHGGWVHGDGTIEANTASSCGGGALLNGAVLSSPTPGGLTLRDNNASGNGGGVCISGVSELTNVRLDNNRASGNYGGGLYQGSGITTLTDTILSGNWAGIGCGLSMESGSELVVNGPVGGAFLDGNNCTGSGAGEAAAYVLGNLTVADTAIANNIAADTSGVWVAGGSATLTNVDLHGNSGHRVVYLTGGSYTHDGGQIFSNLSYGQGGAFQQTSGTLTLSNLSVASNEASGGAVAWVSGGSFEATNCSFTDNTATGVSTDPVRYGGAFHVVGGTVTLHDSVVSRNSAQRGGAVLVEPGGVFTMDCPGALGCEMTDNTATLDGGAIYVEAGAVGGGTVVINGVDVVRNTANQAGDPGAGGAVFLVGGSLDLADMSLSDNTTGSGPGGAISARGASSLTFSNVTVNRNQAGLNGTLVGGAIELRDAASLTSTRSNWGEFTNDNLPDDIYASAPHCFVRDPLVGDLTCDAATGCSGGSVNSCP